MGSLSGVLTGALQIVRSRPASGTRNPTPDMEKPAARGVGAAGSPHCSPRVVRRRRGSHRPVEGRLERVCEADNGPSGPSLQAGKIASRGSSNAVLMLPGYGGPAVVKRLLLASPRGYCAGVERAEKAFHNCRATIAGKHQDG